MKPIIGYDSSKYPLIVFKDGRRVALFDVKNRKIVEVISCPFFKQSFKSCSLTQFSTEQGEVKVITVFEYKKVRGFIEADITLF